VRASHRVRGWRQCEYLLLLLRANGDTTPGFEIIDSVAFLYRLLPPRPTFAQEMSAEESAVMEHHVAYWQNLLNQDVALAFGPVLGPEDPWGLGLLDLDDEQAARAVGDEDPAVESGTCTYKLVPMELVRPG
jgi:uncharacterized protein